MSKNILVEVFGEDLDQAINIAVDNGYHIRVTKVDGNYKTCIRDYRLDRVNVELENNIVIKADIG